MLPKLLKNMETEKLFPNSFRASITLRVKPDKDKTKQSKQNYKSISLMNIFAEILHKLANQIQAYIKTSFIHDKTSIIPEMW